MQATFGCVIDRNSGRIFYVDLLFGTEFDNTFQCQLYDRNQIVLLPSRIDPPYITFNWSNLKITKFIFFLIK